MPISRAKTLNSPLSTINRDIEDLKDKGITFEDVDEELNNRIVFSCDTQNTHLAVYSWERLNEIAAMWQLAEMES